MIAETEIDVNGAGAQAQTGFSRVQNWQIIRYPSPALFNFGANSGNRTHIQTLARSYNEPLYDARISTIYTSC